MEEICASVKHVLMVFHMIMNPSYCSHIFVRSCVHTNTHTHTHFYLLAPFLCTFLWYYYFYTIFVFSLCVWVYVCLSVCLFLYISLVIKPSKWFCATCGFDTPPLQIFFYNTYFYIERIWLSLRIFSSLYMNIYIYAQRFTLHLIKCMCGAVEIL